MAVRSVTYVFDHFPTPSKNHLYTYVYNHATIDYMNRFRHQLPSGVSRQVSVYGHELWHPAVSLPLFVSFRMRKAKCSACDRVFKTEEDYSAHFFYYAVVLGESTVQPVAWRDVTKITGDLT